MMQPVLAEASGFHSDSHGGCSLTSMFVRSRSAEDEGLCLCIYQLCL